MVAFLLCFLKGEYMNFLDLFSGVGGFRLGMEKAGHQCVGYVEIDKFARKSYEAIHDTKGEWTAHDITLVTNDYFRLLRGRTEVICGGFPCQPFSMAGSRKSFEDTRGTLFFDIARATEQIKPRFLLLENVKGLLSSDKGKTFTTILNTLDELGYDAEWQVFNSKEFSTKEQPTPQHRERVFIIGHSREKPFKRIFPITGESTEVQIPTGKPIKIRENVKKGYSIAYPYDGIRLDHPNSKTGRGRIRRGLSPTLTTSCEVGVIIDEDTIRQITPREAWRLQGFPDWAYERASKVNSKKQLYKQAGNSVTVNVVYEIAKRLY